MTEGTDSLGCWVLMLGPVDESSVLSLLFSFMNISLITVGFERLRLTAPETNLDLVLLEFLVIMHD